MTTSISQQKRNVRKQAAALGHDLGDWKRESWFVKGRNEAMIAFCCHVGCGAHAFSTGTFADGSPGLKAACTAKAEQDALTERLVAAVGAQS